jgi:hypothetical protein
MITSAPMGGDHRILQEFTPPLPVSNEKRQINRNSNNSNSSSIVFNDNEHDLQQQYQQDNRERKHRKKKRRERKRGNHAQSSRRHSKKKRRNQSLRSVPLSKIPSDIRNLNYNNYSNEPIDEQQHIQQNLKDKQSQQLPRRDQHQQQQQYQQQYQQQQNKQQKPGQKQYALLKSSPSPEFLRQQNIVSPPVPANLAVNNDKEMLRESLLYNNVPEQHFRRAHESSAESGAEATTSIRVTIASKLSPNEIMRMIVRRNLDRKDYDGKAWAFFVRGARNRLGIEESQRIRVYDTSNLEIRSIDDIMPGDHLILVPMSEREKEISVLQNPAPHPFHHRLYRDSIFVGGPHSVGITTFYNHREQHEDIKCGIKMTKGKNVPVWEKESRMTPAEKRFLENQEANKMNEIAISNLMKHGGSMGINTWFNRKEQTGDKHSGLKRFQGFGESKQLGHPLTFSYDAKDVHRDHHINRVTTYSRSRWKDFDPSRLPFGPPHSSKSVPHSRGSTTSTNSSTLRVPNMPFPQEFSQDEINEMGFVHENYSQNTASTRGSLNSGNGGGGSGNSGGEIKVAGTYRKSHTSISKGKKQFYSPTPNKFHRKLITPTDNRLSKAVVHASMYNPLKTTVGSLLVSPTPPSRNGKIER